MKMKFKRGQIGETLTWFTAFVIITFLIVLFLMLIGFLVESNKLSFGQGMNYISVSGEGGSLAESKNLVSFLNSEIEGEKVYDFIEKSVKKDIIYGEMISLESRPKIAESAKSFFSRTYPVSEEREKDTLWNNLWTFDVLKISNGACLKFYSRMAKVEIPINDKKIEIKLCYYKER